MQHFALAELKPVPDEVLHDFPELAAKYAQCRAEESAEPVVVKKVKQLNLPDGVPEVIEVDVGGRTPVWVAALIVKVDGQKMMCRRADNGEPYKTKLYGRDIEWRVPLAAW